MELITYIYNLSKIISIICSYLALQFYMLKLNISLSDIRQRQGAVPPDPCISDYLVFSMETPLQKSWLCPWEGW